MPGSTLVVVSYVLLAVFVVVFVVRALKMARMPVHLRWELAPVPHEKGKSRYGGSYLEDYEWWTKPREKSLASELIYMFLEIVFLKALWEHRRQLWWFSFPLHFGLYLLIVTLAIVVLAALAGLVGLTIADWAPLQIVVSILAIVGYIMGAVGAIGLLLTRLFSSRMKGFTSTAALFNLLLLFAVFISGINARLDSGTYAVDIVSFATAVFTANTELAAQMPGLMVVHVLLTLVFMAYLPFSQMMHFVAKYFTYHEVRWNDEPLVPGGRMEKEVLELLSQPVTWSGAHLNADGKKNWVDIATEETPK